MVIAKCGEVLPFTVDTVPTKPFGKYGKSFTITVRDQILNLIESSKTREEMLNSLEGFVQIKVREEREWVLREIQTEVERKRRCL